MGRLKTIFDDSIKNFGPVNGTTQLFKVGYGRCLAVRGSAVGENVSDGNSHMALSRLENTSPKNAFHDRRAINATKR